VVAYDPFAVDEARRLYAGHALLTFAKSALGACDGADALAIVTEWKQFRSPDFGALKSRLKHCVIFDGRNLYEPDAMAAHGIEYVPVGRPGADRGQAYR
jgi:UDPglucose 6-dehydrogenase